MGGFNEPPATTDLKRMLAAGTISQETITQAAGRVLLQMERFGYLDGKGQLAVTPTDPVASAPVIQKTAEDSAVLLKNTGNALPLRPEQLSNIVLIGPGARQTVAVGQAGEKAVGLPERAIGPLAALQQFTPAAATIKFAVGNDMEGVPVPADVLTHDGKHGLHMTGAATSAAEGTRDGLNLTRSAGTALPPDTSATWTGTLNTAEAGNYRLHLQVLGCYSTLEIDGQLIAKNGLMWIHGDITQPAQDNVLPTMDGLNNLRVSLPLTAGPHTVRIRVVPDSSHAATQVRLNWVTPAAQTANYGAAIQAARQAKTAVVFAWSRGRPTFALPGDQDKLIQDVAAANPNTIVVLNVSQPVAMPWLADVKAVLTMWWPGNEGGPATARVLLGQVSPAGRLPFTWPRRIEDTPAGDPRYPERSGDGVSGKTTFSEGVLVGYRWFDAQKIAPLFPFGFGLSYSRFSYSALHVVPSIDGGFEASVTVKNTGTVNADDVVQLYIAKPSPQPAGAQFAERVLAGFERVHLRAGESRTVKMHASLRSLQFWSVEKNAWQTPAGARTVLAGGASRDLPLHAEIAATR